LLSGKKLQKPFQTRAWEGVFSGFHKISLIVEIKTKHQCF